MAENTELKKALDTLHEWTLAIAREAGQTDEAAELLWGKIKSVPEVLREYAYYHDRGEALCEYSVQGYTLADIMIWQIDHFRSHMDRLDNVNKFNPASLLFDSFLCLIQLKENPAEIISRFAGETGTDLASGWTIG